MYGWYLNDISFGYKLVTAITVCPGTTDHCYPIRTLLGLAWRAGLMPEVFGDGAKGFPAQRGKMLSREFNYTLMWIFGCRILMVHPSFSPQEDSLWSSLSSLTGGLWSTLLYALARGIQTWPAKQKPPMIMTAVLRTYHGKIPKVFSLFFTYCKKSKARVVEGIGIYWV